MKAMALALTFLSFAAVQAADTATCTLEAYNYSTVDYVEYTLVGKNLLSQQTVRTIGTENVLEDIVFPVSYFVVVAADNSAKGRICLKEDQLGPCEIGSQAELNSPLQLTLVDLFKNGKTEYKLTCQLD